VARHVVTRSGPSAGVVSRSRGRYARSP